MSLDFQGFPKISSFSKTPCYRYRMEKPSEADQTVVYGAKVKLHGTNAAVLINCQDGSVGAQSRSRMIVPGDDNAGFARWVHFQKDKFRASIERVDPSVERMAIFGEWAGKGVQKGDDAVLQLPDKHFFVFGVLLDDKYITDPDVIGDLVPGNVSNMHVLPWFKCPSEDESMQVKMTDEKSVDDFVAFLNAEIEKIAVTDPYIDEVFGVRAPGEGLVLTPFEVREENITKGEVAYDMLADYVFKAKTEAHRVQLTKQAVTKGVAVPENVSTFVKDFVTRARCEQGLTEACGGERDKTKMGMFLKWMANDVKSESAEEVKEMGLDWKDVSKYVISASRQWFLDT